MEDRIKERDVTIGEIIGRMYDANENTLSMCSRLSVIVDRLLVGEQPCNTSASGTDGCSPPVRGELTILNDNAERHVSLNEYLDKLVSQLERVIK